MRTSAITAAVLAFSTIASAAIADDDFSALLADLSFGDAPSLNAPNTEALTVVQEETLQDLTPVPDGMTMPGMLENAPGEQTLSMPEIMAPASQENVAANQIFAPQPAPQVALMDPVPATVPVESIDLDAAFALQDVQATPAKSVGHLLNSQCETGHCDTGVYCRPRQPVHLPSSTLYEYFRSHPCYTNVWDGYGIHCGNHHKHLHGECDCFKQSCNGCDEQGKCDTCGRH